MDKTRIFMRCVFLLPNARIYIFSSKRFFMRKGREVYKQRIYPLPNAYCVLQFYVNSGTIIKKLQGDYSRYELMMNIILDALTARDKTDQVDDQVTDQVKALLDCMESDELSASQIMERLNLSHRPNFRKNYLGPALDAGLIEMTIPDKPNSRNQKYRRIK